MEENACLGVQHRELETVHRELPTGELDAVGEPGWLPAGWAADTAVVARHRDTLDPIPAVRVESRQS